MQDWIKQGQESNVVVKVMKMSDLNELFGEAVAAIMCGLHFTIVPKLHNK